MPKVVPMSALDSVLRRSVELGAAAGVVGGSRDARGIFYQGAFGKRSADAPAAMTDDTIFRIFSMTKAVGSVAAAQLFERGELDLDAPVESYCPRFRRTPGSRRLRWR